MNCSQTKHYIDDYLDNSLSSIQQQALNQHLSACAPCRQQLEQARMLLLGLRDMSVPAPDRQFEQRVLSVLDAEQSAPISKTGFIAGFGSALAASLMLWLVFATNVFNSNSDKVNDITLQLASSEVHNIRLMFGSPDELADATLVLALDGDIELDGHPGRRQLQWKTALKKGNNRLSLPVRVMSNKGGMLLASISRDGKTKSFRINVVSGIHTSQPHNASTITFT